MALIVGGTTVTGTQVLDATKLSGNLPAISGASLTNLPSATNTFNTVGSYTLAGKTSSGFSQNGTQSAGAFFQGKDLNGNEKGNIYSGTWRNMCGTVSVGIGVLCQRQS